VKTLARQLRSVGIAGVCLGITAACVRVSEPAPGEIVGTWRLQMDGDGGAVEFGADQTCHADPAFAAFVASCNGPGRKSSDDSCFWGPGKNGESDELQVVMKGDGWPLPGTQDGCMAHPAKQGPATFRYVRRRSQIFSFAVNGAHWSCRPTIRCSRRAPQSLAGAALAADLGVGRTIEAARNEAS
jgi:hypothetical protein